MERIRGFLLHISVICSLACITAEALDWYNPYMNFSGHTFFVQLVLYLSVMLLCAGEKSSLPNLCRAGTKKKRNSTSAEGECLNEKPEKYK